MTVNAGKDKAEEVRGGGLKSDEDYEGSEIKMR